MKKNIIVVLLLLLIFPAQAADISGYWASLSMSDEFTDKLEKCSSYTEQKTAEIYGVSTTSVYTIKGLKNKKCVVEITNKSDDGVIITQECLLDGNAVQNFSVAMQQLSQDRHNHDIVLLQNEHYAEAWRILFNEKICKFRREKNDVTAMLREHLINCSPYMQSQNFGILQITREVVEKDDNFCIYKQTIKQNQLPLKIEKVQHHEMLQNLLQYIQEHQFVTECKFSKEQIREYNDILKKMIIPAAVGLDNIMQPLERGAILSEENDFLEQNCTLLMPEE